jgi:hypothetical protein
MSFKDRRRGMELELALEKTTACATHFSEGSATCANQPCTVQKADFPRVNSAPLQYFLRATVFSSRCSAQLPCFWFPCPVQCSARRVGRAVMIFAERGG